LSRVLSQISFGLRALARPFKWFLGKDRHAIRGGRDDLNWPFASLRGNAVQVMRIATGRLRTRLARSPSGPQAGKPAHGLCRLLAKPYRLWAGADRQHPRTARGRTLTHRSPRSFGPERFATLRKAVSVQRSDHGPYFWQPSRYLTTRIAFFSTSGGTVIESACAVFKFTMSSCWRIVSTGRSLGLAPFNIRST
jgi:hypothetical protein